MRALHPTLLQASRSFLGFLAVPGAAPSSRSVSSCSCPYYREAVNIRDIAPCLLKIPKQPPYLPCHNIWPPLFNNLHYRRPTMSLNRVSSLETYTTIPVGGTRSRSASEASTRARKLTFNPLPEQWNPTTPTDQPPAIGAFEVPKWKRLRRSTCQYPVLVHAAGLLMREEQFKSLLASSTACSRPASSLALRPSNPC